MSHPFAEEALVGAILLGAPIADVQALCPLTQRDFAIVPLGCAWAAMLELASAGAKIEAVAVATAICAMNPHIARQLPADPARYLIEMMDSCPLKGDFLEYARAVSEASRHRTACALVGSLGAEIRTLTPPDTLAWLTEAAGRLCACTGDPTLKAVSIRSLATETYRRMCDKTPPVSIQTGFTTLDRHMGGLRPKRLYVLSAEAKGGKTSLATQWAWQALQLGVPVMFFSMEMSREELGDRIASQHTGIEKAKLDGATPPTSADMRAFLDYANLATKSEHGFYVDESRLTLQDIRARTLAWLAKPEVALWRGHPCKGLVVVDYLQLVTPRDRGRNSGTREQEIAEVSDGLKALAKEADIPVVALAQLNRQGDLRHSGQIVMDADVAIRIRPRIDEPPAAGIKAVRRMVLDITHNRHGASGEVFVVFDGKVTRFREEAYGGE